LSGIFITYRRDDSQGFAGRLEDDLSERFGDALIFRDREIPPGEDFTKLLRDTLNSTDVALAVIGPRWVDCRNPDGQRRLDVADDWVRLEIETTLARGIPVVPVLVGGALMPSSTDLPESLAEFSRRQAFPLSDLRWRDEIEELAVRLARLSPALDHAFRARVGKRNPADTGPAIRETADRVFNQMARLPAAPPHEPLWTPRLLRWLAARAKKLITIAIVLAIAYIVIREFGGPQLNSFLDRFVTRTIDTVRNVTTRDP
jgi:hypothetical protein